MAQLTKGKLAVLSDIEELTLGFQNGASPSPLHVALLAFDGSIIKTLSSSNTKDTSNGISWHESPQRDQHELDISMADLMREVHALVCYSLPGERPASLNVYGMGGAAIYGYAPLDDEYATNKKDIWVLIHADDGVWRLRIAGEFVEVPKEIVDSLDENVVLPSSSVAVFMRDPRWLSINVLGGRSLASFDVNGKSDPYVRVSFCGQEFTTDTVSRSLNPTFKRGEFRAVLWTPRPSGVIRFNMYDYDKLKKDDFMGTATLDVGKELDGDAVACDQWLKLSGGEKVKGDVHVQVRLL